MRLHLRNAPRAAGGAHPRQCLLGPAANPAHRPAPGVRSQLPVLDPRGPHPRRPTGAGYVRQSGDDLAGRQLGFTVKKTVRNTIASRPPARSLDCPDARPDSPRLSG